MHWFKHVPAIGQYSGADYKGHVTYNMGGGGGGGGPQQVTQTTSNLPEYARPYFEDLLGAAGAETFTRDPFTGQMTGLQPYVPYRGQRIQGFMPSQVQTQQETMGLRTPGEFGAAPQFTAAGGLGSFGLGQQAAGVGQQYFGMATDPSQIQQFMSPYQQAVTDVQKSAAVREAKIAQQQANLGSARQGTYGGARQAIAQAERERGLLDRLSQIQGQGSQSAFERAQQAQQFGSTLGLQGLQTGLQGMQQLGQAGATLGQLGTQRQAADLARLQAQQQVGAQQQALEQQRLDTAYADFLRQRDYPMEQLGYYSNLLRGLPMQLASTQTTYAAPPSTFQQVAGAGAGLYGLGKATGMFKEGGEVKNQSHGIASVRLAQLTN